MVFAFVSFLHTFASHTPAVCILCTVFLVRYLIRESHLTLCKLTAKHMLAALKIHQGRASEQRGPGLVRSSGATQWGPCNTLQRRAWAENTSGWRERREGHGYFRCIIRISHWFMMRGGDAAVVVQRKRVGFRLRR